MVDFVKPSELTAAATVYADDALIVDNGGVVQKATPVQVANAGAPVSTQAQATAGTDNSTRMTPLRVRQVLDDTMNPSVLRAEAWAESATNPDPANPSSKSAKTWAAEAAAREQEAQDHADSAAGFAADTLAIKNQLLNDLQVDATTLSAGVPATATYDPNTLTVSFGIPTGPQGANGTPGVQGSAATVVVGTTTTGAEGTNATVTNVGTSSAAVLNFTIPRGDTGAQVNPEVATTTSNGLMSSGDKIKLDGIADGAQVNRAISTQPQAEAGADNTSSMTPLRVEQHMLANALGWGQTWNNMTSQRAENTLYRNETGKPIYVTATCDGRIGFLEVSNGTSSSPMVAASGFNGTPTQDTNARTTRSVVVPHLHYYRFNSGGQTIRVWSELR